MVEQLKVDWKHRRLALHFNYPNLCLPKKVIVVPYFDDNRVSLSQKSKQICWIQDLNNMGATWVHRNLRDQEGLETSQSDKISATYSDSQMKKSKIYQFLPLRWKLYEYDLAGLMTKIISYEKEMSEFHVLAKSSKDPIFLVTRYGPDYINELQVRGITG